MSQVDYVNYFNNIIWTLIQGILVYIFICIHYVQVFYKIHRLRSVVYNLLKTNLNNEILDAIYMIFLLHINYVELKTDYLKLKNLFTKNIQLLLNKCI